MTAPESKQIVSFKSAGDWERWLDKHHAGSDGVWLHIFTKGSGKASVTYTEAVDVALCYGWIDGQGKSRDEASWVQKFTPRRARSVWSKLNTQRAARLMKAGSMKPAGLKEVAAAKKDGRWNRAYDSPSAAIMPEDFLKELGRNKKAKAFFETLNKRNTYPIAYRLQSAKKPETRERRMQAIVAMLANGERFYP
jgi:uncharacterized protein YdeI (YjbR/CyaY-like superfamily)